jgi:hypothetical protein
VSLFFLKEQHQSTQKEKEKKYAKLQYRCMIKKQRKGAHEKSSSPKLRQPMAKNVNVQPMYKKFDDKTGSLHKS